MSGDMQVYIGLRIDMHLDTLYLSSYRGDF